MLNSLHFLRYCLGLAPALTQTSLSERECLQTHAGGKQRLAEIGVYHGVNTRRFREVMHEDATLLAVDPFHRSFFGLRGYGWARKIAHAEVGKVDRGKVIWLECRGDEVPSRDDLGDALPVDFVFIDGDHSYSGLEADWLAWRDAVAPGGIVALHDSRNRGGCGSEQYTQEVIVIDPDFSVIAEIDSLTVLRRALPRPARPTQVEAGTQA